VRRIGNAWPRAGVRAAAIVVMHPSKPAFGHCVRVFGTQVIVPSALRVPLWLFVLWNFHSNAPIVAAHLVVYANSEDGISTPSARADRSNRGSFLDLALGAAYTQAIGPDGRIYTENNGTLFVVGE